MDQRGLREGTAADRGHLGMQPDLVLLVVGLMPRRLQA
jgi:hypothetical protein